MPLPVLLGLPALISAVTGTLGVIAAATVSWIVKKGVIKTLFLAATLSLISAFVVFLDAQIGLVLAQLNGTNFGALTYSIMPTTTSTVISIALLVDVTKWTYDQSQGLVSKKFS